MFVSKTGSSPSIVDSGQRPSMPLNLPSFQLSHPFWEPLSPISEGAWQANCLMRKFFIAPMFDKEFMDLTTQEITPGLSSPLALKVPTPLFLASLCPALHGECQGKLDAVGCRP